MDIRRVLIVQSDKPDFLECAGRLREAGISSDSYFLSMDFESIKRHVVPNKKQLLILDDFGGNEVRATMFAMEMKSRNSLLMVAHLSRRKGVPGGIYDFTFDTEGPEGFFGHLVEVVRRALTLEEGNDRTSPTS